MTAVGILHPGEMGITLAASAQNSGHEVYWCEDGRSEATRSRAEALDLESLPTLQALCDTCQVLISVCPPHAATELAADVIASGFSGLYADVNAIAPDTVTAIGRLMSEAGIAFVDGGIIGLPPVTRGTTWLYLSGPDAGKIAECFSGGPMETTVLGEEIGKASGLKMCFAANSKGTVALHTAILGTAEAMGVREALEKQWETYNPGFTAKTHARIRHVARKAWRFTGEMNEIAETLDAAGMPREFFLAAAEVYSRQADYKNIEDDPSIEEILATVLKKK